MTGAKVPAVSSRRSAFMNYLLWYLGCMFLMTGIALFAGLALFRAGYKFGAWISPSGLMVAGYSFQRAIFERVHVVNTFIAVIVALRCRVRLWMAFPAWIIGFLALWLL